MIAIRDCDGRGRRTDRGQAHTTDQVRDPLLGPNLFFVTGLVIFATAVARLVCPDLLG